MAFSLFNKLSETVSKAGASAPAAESTADTTQEQKPQFHELFIHPDDKIASDKFKALPKFDSVINTIKDSGLDKAIHMNNMTSFMRINADQFPKLYNRTAALCAKLKIDVPEIFLDLSSESAAEVSGLSQTTIVYNPSVLDYLEEPDILNVIISHQLGHIFCKNCVYRTIVKHFGLIEKTPVGALLGSFLPSIEAGLNYWYRKSELSADRVAAAICGSAETVIEAEMKLCDASDWFIKNADIKAWAGQIDEIKADADLKDGIVQNILALTNKHSISAIRVRELLKWTKTEDFGRIKAQLDSGEF